MNKQQYRDFRPLLFIFVFVTAFCITGKDWMLKQGISREVVVYGNILLFAVSILTWVIYRRSMQSPVRQSGRSEGAAAVRAMYLSFMLKFFVLAIAAFIYIILAKKNVNKAGLIICAGLYVLYTFFETRALMRLAKQRSNA